MHVAAGQAEPEAEPEALWGMQNPGFRPHRMHDMTDTSRPSRTAAAPRNGDDPSQALRRLGSRAHQLRAALRAADHYNSQDQADDRNTGSWLTSSAVTLAEDLAADIDSLVRSVKEGAAESALQQAVAAARVRAHQLNASARAADHFLDQDNPDDRETGSWLIAGALSLAEKLAAELDDSVAPARKLAA